MSTTVMYNAGAQLSLGELNKSINKIGKALTMVATGEKITGAKDDSESFAISEVMREKLRTLEQDNQNVQNGSAMLRIAAGGIENIVSELKELRELAIDAANDSNTDDDRRVMQKVLDQKRANIEDIAVSTNYNGKRLLNGTYTRPSADISYQLVKIEPNDSSPVTAKKPGIKKIRNADGTVTLLQKNMFPELIENFEAVNDNISRKTNVRSNKRGIECDFAFDGSGSKNTYNWGDQFRYDNNNLASDTMTTEIFSARNASQRQVVEGFAKSLDAAVNTNISDVSSNGKFGSLKEAMDSFLTDLRNNQSNFLVDYCGIDLNNQDTGAITGSDAGGSTKTSDSVVPESNFGSWRAPTTATSNFNGLTVKWPTLMSSDSTSDIKVAILSGLNGDWIDGSLELIEESFGMNLQESGKEFNASSSPNIEVSFVNSSQTDDLVYLSGDRLYINMSRCADLTTPREQNGKVDNDNLDREIARELTKVVMRSDIQNYDRLPAYIKEGMAELTTGADDTLTEDIQALINDPNKMASALSTSTSTVSISGIDDPSAAAGYVFMRYLAKQSEGADISLNKVIFDNEPTTDTQTGVKMKFDLSNVKSVDELDGEGFSILCGKLNSGGCPQYLNFTFDSSIGAEDSSMTRDATDSYTSGGVIYRSDYTIGVRDIDLNDPNSLAEAIFKGVASMPLTSSDDPINNRQGENSDGKSEFDIRTAKNNELVNVVIDGHHGVRIAKDPSDPEGKSYVLLKENRYMIDFVNQGYILAIEQPGEIDDLGPGDDFDFDDDTEITIGKPVYDYVEHMKKGNPLTIHHGTKSNEAINFYIDSMRTSALKSAVPNRNDLEQLLNDEEFVKKNADLVQQTAELKAALDQFMIDPSNIEYEPLSSILAAMSTDNKYEEQYPDLTMMLKFPDQAADRLKEFPQLKSQMEEALIKKELLENAEGEQVDILKDASGKTLDDITFLGKQNPPLTPAQSSKSALRVIEGALTYALENATDVGAYLQRLDFSQTNIETQKDNVQAAESVIRDADMAKSITEYTKNNVMMQAAQSMLAQANQNQSSVLSLIQ